MKIHVLSLFPSILEGPLSESIIKKAREKGLLNIETVNIRDFTHDRHRTADDKPYGGGVGMVMKPEPVFEAVDSLNLEPEAKLILTTPQGRLFDQNVAEELAQEKHLVFICGHYEGIDERVNIGLKPLELSIGNYVLTNGTIAAAVMIDAVSRLVPGVVGRQESVDEDTFTSGGLKHVQYTRPAVYRGMEVPEVLRNGNHREIEEWRKSLAREREIERFGENGLF